MLIFCFIDHDKKWYFCATYDSDSKYFYVFYSLFRLVIDKNTQIQKFYFEFNIDCFNLAIYLIWSLRGNMINFFLSDFKLDLSIDFLCGFTTFKFEMINKTISSSWMISLTYWKLIADSKSALNSEVVRVSFKWLMTDVKTH